MTCSVPSVVVVVRKKLILERGLRLYQGLRHSHLGHDHVRKEIILGRGLRH